MSARGSCLADEGECLSDEKGCLSGGSGCLADEKGRLSDEKLACRTNRDGCRTTRVLGVRRTRGLREWASAAARRTSVGDERRELFVGRTKGGPPSGGVAARHTKGRRRAAGVAARRTRSAANGRERAGRALAVAHETGSFGRSNQPSQRSGRKPWTPFATLAARLPMGGSGTRQRVRGRPCVGAGPSRR